MALLDTTSGELLETGTLLHGGKWEIRSLLGKGGMGTVYRVRHTELREIEAAIKLLHLRDDPDMKERFIRESEVLARVKSNHIVRILDRGLFEDTPYIVMELLNGHDLHHEIKQAPEHRLPVERVAEVALGVVVGLRALHEYGILHRDIKPSNIFLHNAGEGEVVKVFDFGISSIPYGAAITIAQMYTGSPAFSSPEQLRAPATGDIVDVRTDQFSLAVTMFLALTGELPWGLGAMHAKSEEESHKFRRAQVRGDYLKLNELRPDVPGPLVAAIHKALSVDPDKRFARVEDFGNAIRPFASELSRGLFERSMNKSSYPVRPDQTVPIRRETFKDSKPATFNGKKFQELPLAPSKAQTRASSDIPTRVVQGPPPEGAMPTGVTYRHAEVVDPLDATQLDPVRDGAFPLTPTEAGAVVDASASGPVPRAAASGAAQPNAISSPVAEFQNPPDYEKAIAAAVGNTKVLPSDAVARRPLPKWVGFAIAGGAAAALVAALSVASFRSGGDGAPVPAEELQILKARPVTTVVTPDPPKPLERPVVAPAPTTAQPAPLPEATAPLKAAEPVVTAPATVQGPSTDAPPRSSGSTPSSKQKKKPRGIIYTPSGSPIFPP